MNCDNYGLDVLYYFHIFKHLTMKHSDYLNVFISVLT